MATEQERIERLEQQVATLQAQVATLLGETTTKAGAEATAFAAGSTYAASPEGTIGTVGSAPTPGGVSLGQVTATLQRVLQDAQARPSRNASPIAATLRSMDVELRAFVTMPQAATTATTGEQAAAVTGETPVTDAPDPPTSDVQVSTPALGQPVNSQALSVFRFSFATVPTPPGAAAGKVS